MKTHFPLFNAAADPAAVDPGTGGGAASPWYETIVQKGADGTESLTDFAAWKDKAPAPLRDFITANMTAARSKTDGMVRVPGADAKPEEVAAYFKAIGVPDTPDGYRLKAPEKVPEGVALDADMEKAFLGRARELGLTAKQVTALRDFQLEHLGGAVVKNREAMAATIAAEKADLDKRFGDKINDTVAQAKAIANQKWMPDGMKKYIEDGALDPAHGNFAGADFLEFMAQAAKATGEDRGGAGIRGSNTGSNTREYWIGVMKDKDHPDKKLLDKQDPDAVRRYNEAYRNEV
ncbi:MAG: hypothetical protein JWO08_1689 [Verrucomicrobiaceae bacterium]|nr:hypothetical protein [Verrucomicrobiaceae bacterium]